MQVSKITSAADIFHPETLNVLFTVRGRGISKTEEFLKFLCNFVSSIAFEES